MTATRAPNQSDLLQGTLDLLVLKTLSLEPMHGWGVAQRLLQFSGGVFNVNQGSLYPALQRLERRGWIGAEWALSENRRRAKYYRLTQDGEAALAGEVAQWEAFTAAVQRVLRATLEEP